MTRARIAEWRPADAADTAAPRRGWRGYLRILLHGMVLAGLLFLGYLFIVVAPDHKSMGLDALAYWMVQVPGAYDIPHRTAGSFPYAPPMAILMDPFGALEFWVFLWLWTALLVASLIWIGRTVGWILVAFAIPFVAVELYLSNIHILLAVAVLLGRRHAWTWALVLLTKASCGVGLLWFVVRREWRSLGIALGATAVLAGLSLLIAPGLWPDWIDYVITAQNLDDRYWTNVIHIPLWLRLAAAVVLVVWGARTDRYWTVLVAVTLGLPVLWFHGLALLVGLVAEIRRYQERIRSGQGVAAETLDASTSGQAV